MGGSLEWWPHYASAQTPAAEKSVHNRIANSVEVSGPAALGGRDWEVRERGNGSSQVKLDSNGSGSWIYSSVGWPPFRVFGTVNRARQSLDRDVRLCV